MRGFAPRHWLSRLPEYLRDDFGEKDYPPEVDVEAIPELPPGGWKLYPVDEMQIGGAVPKDYLAYGPLDEPSTVGYIAKRPRVYGHRECVTEQMISRIGHLLPLKVARSKLVRLPSRDGEPDVRFLSRNFLVPGRTQLKHGVELVADYVGTSRAELQQVFNLADKASEREFYTLETIFCVLSSLGRTPEEAEALQAAFARMIAFDALIGAQDRHAENWGVIEHPGTPELPRSFAPVYDTARGLFADHREHKFLNVEKRGMRDDYIRKYAERSRPVFSCADGPEKVNHFQLMELGIRKFGDVLRRPLSQIVTAYHHEEVSNLLNREFRRLISPLRMLYVAALLKVRHERLRAILEARD